MILIGGDQFGFQGGAMCKAILDFVKHQQPTSLSSLLQRRPAQRFQHVVDTRGVPKPRAQSVPGRTDCCSLVAPHFATVPKTCTDGTASFSLCASEFNLMSITSPYSSLKCKLWRTESGNRRRQQLSVSKPVLPCCQ